ncbi:hypothetical protein GOBAR_DD26275 [Gossypium barbadense]|nr:hypothetical protein GOBAR_DD26275 [Gossypium barbadense]
MESKWLAMVLVVLSLGSGLCDGCLEEERFALFQLKPFFEFIDYKFQDLINDDFVYEKESSSNCCFERLSSKLDKLENLDLSDNHFNNNILASLSELSSLKSLNLAENVFTRSNPTNDLNALSNLEELILSGNEVNGFIPSQGLRLMNLKHLDLSGNGFNNSILSSLATLSNLKTLSVGVYLFNGLTDMKDLYGLSNLEELYMACTTGN